MKPQQGVPAWRITVACLGTPILLLGLVLGLGAAFGKQTAPGLSAQLYLTSTTAQVGATVIAVFAAAVTLVLSRPELRGADQALAQVMRMTQSVLASITLLLGTSLAMVVPAILPEPGPNTSGGSWGLTEVLSVGASVLVVSGLLSAGWWLVDAQRILSPDTILMSLVQRVSPDWATRFNEEAGVLWKTAYDEALKQRSTLPLSADDVNALTLPANNEMAVALDAITGWISSAKGLSIAGDLQALLDDLFPRLVGANDTLAGAVLPAHLSQLLKTALESDDPRVIWVVARWISDLHLGWEESGARTARANHFNWLMPPLGLWLLSRGFDRPAQQVFGTVFQSATKQTKAEAADAMGIAMGHFIWLLRLAVEARHPSAFELWQPIDNYLRFAGPRSPKYAVTQVRYVLLSAKESRLPAFGKESSGYGGLAEWMAIGIGQAIRESQKRSGVAAAGSPKALAEQEWSMFLADLVESVFPGAYDVRWNGKPVTELRQCIAETRRCAQEDAAGELSPSDSDRTKKQADGAFVWLE